MKGGLNPMRNEPRERQTSRPAQATSADRGSVESGSSAGRDASNGVCCDDEMIGAERFPRKGDGDDEYDE